MPSSLEQSIFRTIAWFSLFETPVTVFEIWKWMLEPNRPYSLEEVYAALDGDWLRGRLAKQDGYRTLLTLSISNPSGFASERRARFVDATRKYAKLRRAARYLALIPWIDGVAAGNTLAWWNTRQDSDIDVFLVVRPGTIWLSRLAAVAPFALAGKRPGSSKTDSFCFSFFAASDSLDLSGLRLPGGDPYLAYWASSLVPVVDDGGLFESFVESNAWTSTMLPHANAKRQQRNEREYSQTRRFPRLPTLSVSILERVAKVVQMRRLPVRIRRVMNVGTSVVVTDSMLKFHENDRREEYRKRLASLLCL
jgi:hypothetical protein